MAVSGNKEFHIKADPAKVMAAIVAVERVPEWSSSHKAVIVESTHPDGRPLRVRMKVSVLGVNDEQVVDYQWVGDEKVSWTLVQSDQQKTQDGSYTLVADGDGTNVTFDLTVDLKIPMPGFIVKRGQKIALETASKGLTKFLETF
ncbi:SRPBCC family protein [Rhodococcus maanshanensis]|uniref:Polyketide cyclase / dehydrase and lipid transport n=1 Tax=Rhodococcus maanshanensis TaxID=183556 RepID=A0A1H7G7L2_9NOCA|nr:SRPBCC family protein [Rhodococcus maanshanensis]SEK34054.1 Polyketide cyclase / dehydrase and lipid transport [Rhodococcus maanshanensis]